MPAPRNLRRDDIGDDGDGDVFEDAGSEADESSSGNEETGGDNGSLEGHEGERTDENRGRIGEPPVACPKSPAQVDKGSTTVEERAAEEEAAVGKGTYQENEPALVGIACESGTMLESFVEVEGRVVDSDIADDEADQPDIIEEHVPSDRKDSAVEKVDRSDKDPWYVPRGHRYFLHDDRMSSEPAVEGTKESEVPQEGAEDPSGVTATRDTHIGQPPLPRATQTRTGPSRSLWSTSGPADGEWQHDKFFELVNNNDGHGSGGQRSIQYPRGQREYARGTDRRNMRFMYREVGSRDGRRKPIAEQRTGPGFVSRVPAYGDGGEHSGQYEWDETNEGGNESKGRGGKGSVRGGSGAEGYYMDKGGKGSASYGYWDRSNAGWNDEVDDSAGCGSFQNGGVSGPRWESSEKLREEGSSGANWQRRGGGPSTRGRGRFAVSSHSLGLEEGRHRPVYRSGGWKGQSRWTTSERRRPGDVSDGRYLSSQPEKRHDHCNLGGDESCNVGYDNYGQNNSNHTDYARHHTVGVYGGLSGRDTDQREMNFNEGTARQITQDARVGQERRNRGARDTIRISPGTQRVYQSQNFGKTAASLRTGPLHNPRGRDSGPGEASFGSNENIYRSPPGGRQGHIPAARGNYGGGPSVQHVYAAQPPVPPRPNFVTGQYEQSH
eukprot:GHVS01045160.1.p1 GENE.GHVS01045160.1~~GHVS01045160.1.p1  ORF type:complete len:665 (+),score=50.55 GHVS01045160.1:107-2101(+)